MLDVCYMKKILFSCLLWLMLIDALGQQKESISQHCIQNIQDSIALELCQIYGLDQGIRQRNIGCGPKATLIDSTNFIKIIDIIDKYGFPSKNTLGEYFRGECVQMAAVAVMLHNPHKIAKDKKILNLLVREYKKGNLIERLLYSFIDKYYFMKTFDTTKKVYYGPSSWGKPCIEDRAISDSLRNEIGLPPLKDEDFKDCSK